MNAPLIEIVVRLATALMATVTFVLLVRLWRMPYPAAPLMRFMAAVVGLLMLWRYFILWLGFQADVGHWEWALVWVQPMNAALLFLLLLSIGLMGLFHSRRILRREP